MHNEFIFRPCGSLAIWQCVNQALPACASPLVLADFLASHNLTIDEDCQFCRIIRFDEDTRIRTTYEYRAYNFAQVRINISSNKL